MKKTSILLCAITLVFVMVTNSAHADSDDFGGLLTGEESISVELVEAVYSADYTTIETLYKASIYSTEPFNSVLFQYNDLLISGSLVEPPELPGYDFIVDADNHQILITPTLQSSLSLLEFQWNASFVNTSPDLIPFDGSSPLIPLVDGSWSTSQDNGSQSGFFSQPGDLADSLDNTNTIWTHTFYNGLRVTPEEFPNLLIDPSTAVPEPATMLLLATGLAVLAGSRIRRRNRGNDL